ncbi:MAG: porin [Phycisphaerae bacterium]
MTKRRTIPALLMATFGLGATCATAEQPSQADLQQQLDALKAEVAQLKAARADAGPAYTQKDVEAAVDSVLRDADKRTSLLAESSSFYGGYIDDKFTIRSADGNFSMSPSVGMHFRTVTNWADNAKSGGRENIDNGFEVRRLKFGLDGNAFTKNLYYNFLWATDRFSGNLVLEEAYARYVFAGNWAVKAGQYKQMVNQESATSFRRFLAADRSMANEILFGGETHVQGVELLYDNGTDGNVQALVGFTDGFNSKNSNFQDPGTSSNPFDFGIEARVNYKFFGDWKSYSDMTAMGNKRDLLVVGAGFDWSQGGDQDVVRHAVDAQYESGPLAVLAAYYGRWTQNVTGGGDDRYDWGVMIQAGYMINAQYELFGRWSMTHLDDDFVTGDSEFCELAIGFNYYIRGQAAKITVDVTWLPNGSPTDLTGLGILGNEGEDQFLIRGQFQLAL